MVLVSLWEATLVQLAQLLPWLTKHLFIFCSLEHADFVLITV